MGKAVVGESVDGDKVGGTEGLLVVEDEGESNDAFCPFVLLLSLLSSLVFRSTTATIIPTPQRRIRSVRIQTVYRRVGLRFHEDIKLGGFLDLSWLSS